jgi:cell division protein FtsA
MGESKIRGFKDGVVTSLEEITKCIKEVVSHAEHEASVKLTDLYVGIGGSHIKGKNSKGRISISASEITANDIKQVIKQATSTEIPQGHQIIHAIPQEFFIDKQKGIKNPIGLTGKELNGSVFIITGNASCVQNISKAINKTGLNYREFVLHSIASSYSVVEPDEKELGCMVVDIGGATTDGIIFQNGNIKDIFTIGIGGNDVTNDISIGLGISRKEAEEIKLKYGIASPELVGNEKIKEIKSKQSAERKFLASIIRARVEEIFELVNQRIKYTELESLPSGVILTGGAVKLREIRGVAEEIFGMPVKIGIPNGIESADKKIKEPSYSASMGLIIYSATHMTGKGMGKKRIGPSVSRFAQRIKRFLLE